MKHIVALIFSGFMIAALTGCDSATGTRVSITTGLSHGNRAATPPVEIEFLTLQVTGAENYSFQQTYSGVAGPLTVELPAPGDYTFNLNATVDAAAATTLKKFMGSATATVQTGDNEITLTMEISETKIVIPDPWNERLVQIDTFRDTSSWIELTMEELSAHGVTFEVYEPFDTAIDHSGNIYIANSGLGNLFKINTVDTTASQVYTVFPEQDIPVRAYSALAIDQANRYLYYASGGSLYRKGLADNAPEETIDLSNLEMSTITGLTVDTEGYVYIADYNVKKISIDTSLTAINEGEISTNIIPTPFDVILKEESLYVTDYNPGLPAIHQVDPSTMMVTATLGNSVETPLSGPRRFLAPYNDEIFFTDEDGNGTVDRIIQVSDITGDGYSTYGSSGTLQGEFRLFEYPQ